MKLSTKLDIWADARAKTKLAGKKFSSCLSPIMQCTRSLDGQLNCKLIKESEKKALLTVVVVVYPIRLQTQQLIHIICLPTQLSLHSRDVIGKYNRVTLRSDTQNFFLLFQDGKNISSWHNTRVDQNVISCTFM